MSSTTASTAILETVEGFLHHHVKEEPDWDTIVKICDECQSAADRTHLVINSLLDNLKDVKSTPEILYNSLVLLDALVKNVSYSRIVVSTKDVCKIMEKTAKLQEKADVAKKIAKSATKTKESAAFTLIYSIPSSSADFDKWAPDDKAMRMIQSWGMLHPAEFPLYLKSVEKWKKAGVVFPAADPEDLVPLPKALSALTSMETNTSSSSPSRSIFSLTSPKQKAEKTPGTPLSRTIFSLTSPKIKPGSSASASSKSDTSLSSPRHRPKFLMASQRLMNAANNASSLLLDMCSNVGEEGFTVDPDVVESCVNKCKEFAPKLSAFIEALLNEADVVMELSETKRELTLNSLLYSKDQVDSAIKLARDIKKGNYDTNPLKRTVKVYDSEHKKSDEKHKKEKSKDEKVKDEKVKDEKTKSEKVNGSGEQIIDFFAVSNNNVINSNVTTTSSSSLPPSPAQPPLLSMMIASPPPSQNVGGSDQLDFFGNSNQNSISKANGNDDFDFFSNSDSSPSTSSLSNMSSPQQLYSLSSVSSPQQPHLPTGNSFLDQLLGEYSVPSPLTFAKPAQPQPQQHHLQSPPQPQHHHSFQSPPQPLHQTQTQTQTQNTDDNFDFFKV